MAQNLPLRLLDQWATGESCFLRLVNRQGFEGDLFLSQQNSSNVNDRPWQTVCLFGAFVLCFVSAAIVSQIYSDVPVIEDHSPLDYFTGGALWIASAISLIIAVTYTETPWKMVFWLAGTSALAILAIDEFMGVHEATQAIVGDDDHSKVFLWAGAPIGLYLIAKVEGIPKAVAVAFVVGYFFHTTYLISDIGDGDYFSLPFELNTLRWTEDICELLFVSTYLFGFLLIISDKLRGCDKAA